MRLAYEIAVRFLKSSKGQTILITSGIAIGVAVQIFIGSLIQGLQKGLIDKTIGNSSQITISSKTNDKLINNNQDDLKRIQDIKDIKKISVSADSNAFLKYNNNDFSILVRGFNIEEADKIYDIKNRIYEGKYPENKDEIIIGKELETELEAKIGDKIQISTSKGNKKDAEIVGFYDLKVASINKNWIITTLDTSQELFNFDNKISSIEIQVNDPFKADYIASEIKNVLSDEDIKIENWKNQNEQLLSGLDGQNVSSIMIQVFVLISVLLGIASVLAITVVQKSKQLGILKAMGIQNKTASQIFLFEGLILGLMGALMGIALGLGIIAMFTKFVVNKDGTPVVNIYMNYKFIGFSGIIAITVSMLAAFIPALKSTKLDPIEVIKNG